MHYVNIIQILKISFSASLMTFVEKKAQLLQTTQNAVQYDKQDHIKIPIGLGTSLFCFFLSPIFLSNNSFLFCFCTKILLIKKFIRLQKVQ